jgi:NAD(P)-dependent dehydrogenase (short-subunit alcohol dehydrogenase family)
VVLACRDTAKAQEAAGRIASAREFGRVAEPTWSPTSSGTREALTGLLLDRIAGRVVTLSSIGHRLGKARDWDSPRNAYARSKLANLLLTFALRR